MATWTYQAVWAESMGYGIPKTKGAVSMTLKRTSPQSVDTSLYKLANSTGVLSSSSTVEVYNSGANLYFGGYGNSGTFAAGSSAHALSGNIYNVPNSILDVGTGGVTISVTTNSGSDSYNYFYFRSGTTFTFSIEVTDKYGASSISASDVNFGSQSTVYISNSNISDLTHEVSWVAGSKSYTLNTTQGASSASYTIPSSWMSETPNATSMTCTISVRTFKSGTQIGSTTTKNITLNVPSNVKPSIGSITPTIYNARAGFYGKYIQNTTGVIITLNNVSANGYATIPSSGYTISMSVTESYTFDSSTLKYTIAKLLHSGTITFYVYVTDSRGRRSDTVSVSIDVIEYAPPVFSGTSAYRCRQNGIADESGTYASIRAVASYSAIDGNSITIDSVYFASITPDTKIPAQSGMISGAEYIVGNGAFLPSVKYFVTFTATDTVGNSVSVTIILQTAAYAIHVKNGGSGVAFGKTSEIANSVEINEGWELYLKGFATLPIIYRTDANARDAIQNPPTGLVCLIPKT